VRLDARPAADSNFLAWRRLPGCFDPQKITVVADTTIACQPAFQLSSEAERSSAGARALGVGSDVRVTAPRPGWTRLRDPQSIEGDMVRRLAIAIVRGRH
jgi:hypothetical protein